MATFQYNDPNYINPVFVGTERYRGALTTDNPSDVYQVKINEGRGSLDIKLDELGADANLSLYRDTNQNRKIDAADHLIATSSTPGTVSEQIITAALNGGDYTLEEGDYLVQVSLPQGQNAGTNYSLNVYNEGMYFFTYQYGNGEYYSGFGYTMPGERFLDKPDGYQFADEDYFPIGRYQINAIANFDHLTWRGRIYVDDYYDANYQNPDGSLGVHADRNPTGGARAHLHPYPYAATTDPDYASLYVGIGKYGLGTEAGLIHLDGHPMGFPVNGAAMFSTSHQADLMPNHQH